jgi:hypothetical protein
MNNRLIKSNDAGGGGACTNTVDLYNPFPDGGGVALYQLNGDATDVSGNYDGTATNVTYGAGKFGQAAVFNGSSSQITTSTNVPITGSFSISFWIKQSSSEYNDIGGGCILDFGYNSAPYMFLWMDTGIVRLSYSGGAHYYTSATTENAWNHILITRDSSNTTSYYINGSLDSTDTGWTANANHKFTIGYFPIRDGGSGDFLAGSIDQVRIFNRALRPYEVEALYTEEYCTPTIVPSEHFNTVLYTGNGTSQSITGVGFEPNLVWIKNRTTTGYEHFWWDSVRGAGGNKDINSDSTNYEGEENTSAYGYLSSFDSNGFTLNSGTTSAVTINRSSDNYVAWNFKAGGAAVTNTDGTITSQVSANTEAGFSIVSYTGNSSSGSTVGHGLSDSPDVVIIKRRNTTGNWITYHSAISGQYLYLNGTNSASTASWLSTSASSFTLSNTYQDANNSGSTYIAYCFAEVEGFSNFGSYVGNGSTSGAKVITGFEPAFIIIKSATGTRSWRMIDNKRSPENPATKDLRADAETAENDWAANGWGNILNFNTNGFEIIGSDTQVNANGETYIYMAFAADPTTIEPSLEDSFNTVVYTGTSGTQSITGVGFQPDLVWAKNRTAGTTAHILSDSVRGIKQLTSSGTDAEGSSTNMITSYDSDGFGVGDAYALCNASGYNFVAWCWKGAELPAINSNGSIPSVVSANPAAGFSIVSYTGTDVNNTIGHGLGIAPNVILFKDRTIARNWRVYHSAIGAGQNLKLNTTDAASSDAAIFQSTTPTENVFYVGASGDVNANTDNFIAYCFAEVAGFSKFGSYTGTGASGNTVTLGFEPAFVMTKNINDNAAFDRWYIQDSVRGGGKLLYANESLAEGNFTSIQFDANGFTINTTDTGINEIGKTYIYMAFANQF